MMSHWSCSFSWESPFLFLTFQIIREGTSCIMQYRGIITKWRSKPSTMIMNYGVLKGWTGLGFVMGQQERISSDCFYLLMRLLRQSSHLEKASSKPSSVSWKKKQNRVLTSSWTYSYLTQSWTGLWWDPPPHPTPHTDRTWTNIGVMRTTSNDKVSSIFRKKQTNWNLCLITVRGFGFTFPVVHLYI